MKKRGFLLAIAFMLAIGLLTGCAGTEPEAPTDSTPDEAVEENDESQAAGLTDPVRLVFSTQDLGTSFNSMTNAFNTVFMPELPRGSSIDVETTSPGGIAASYIISAEVADLTIGNTAPANWATSEGIDDRGVAEGVASLGGGFDEPVLVVIFTEAFQKRTGFTTLEEVIEAQHPVRVATKATGSFGEMSANKVLSLFDVTYDDIKSWGGDFTLTSSSNVVDMLRDNRADMTIDHTNINQPNYVELSMTTPLYYVQLQDETLDRLHEMGYAYQDIAEGSFNNYVKEDIKTVGSPTALLVREDMDEEVAYTLTEAMAEGKSKLVTSFAAFEAFDPTKAWEPANAGAPLHPGAERYYREMGYMK
ncbi:TRAP transporter solute receptor, TAXI family [Alkaliphilus metalliredigens QYMF]|uniref:TRAP transporter solute receptor, TAXI family n=1 Tax=Alkaliphilus metalliredigens (strain QYMF) TaxID=293826 RepID=A6TJU7_ALKMQ|nr:TAXI family TRAP transporter solute-binding subunit [Alkaliphilus metalliredigens]ABR46465.1 TRAP transporter solute receptor, TAXI family [Alkaliphilus metalliredigens QYMF]